ncbi:MAG: LD-carboxypeptidase [Bacilli bacterium]|nr:LD-carboxypeptidase [Bacilli bacterium]
MKKIKPLKKGDTIGIISPAFGTSKKIEEYQYMVDYLEEKGYKVKLGRSNYERMGYLSGSDEVRANDINEMFKDKDVNAIICMRGGYGCSRIIDKLDFEMIKNNPKIISGYSDITVLLNAIYKICDFPTWHGLISCYLGDESKDKRSIEDFRIAMTTPQKNRVLHNLNDDAMTLSSGIAEGKLVGGNLSLLATICGSPYEADFTDKIVFIEEVGEEPYQIDRYLSCLRLRGTLSKAKGFVFGYFTNCNPSESRKNDQSTLDIIKDYFMKLNKPIIYGFSCGHQDPFVSLPIGAKVKMDADNMTITIMEEIYETSTN